MTGNQKKKKKNLIGLTGNHFFVYLAHVVAVKDELDEFENTFGLWSERISSVTKNEGLILLKLLGSC